MGTRHQGNEHEQKGSTNLIAGQTTPSSQLKDVEEQTNVAENIPT